MFKNVNICFPVAINCRQFRLDLWPYLVLSRKGLMNLKLCILTTKRSSLITPVFVEIGYFHFHASGRLTVTNALNTIKWRDTNHFDSYCMATAQIVETFVTVTNIPIPGLPSLGRAYRKIPKKSPSMYKPSKAVMQKNPQLNRPSKYKRPGDLYLENCSQIQSKTKQKR